MIVRGQKIQCGPTNPTLLDPLPALSRTPGDWVSLKDPWVQETLGRWPGLAGGQSDPKAPSKALGLQWNAQTASGSVAHHTVPLPLAWKEEGGT